jgi:hypothetical protein
VAIFDDVKGKKMIDAAKRIKGNPVPLEQLRVIADEALIKQARGIFICLNKRRKNYVLKAILEVR